MAALEGLYQQDPFWVWVALGCVFVVVSLATGAVSPLWPAAGAAVVSLFAATGLDLGLAGEIVVFVVVCAAAMGLQRAHESASSAGAPRRRRSSSSGPVAPPQPGRLVGRIGRTSSEFVNGVGRVWIDGAEWAAELDAGEDVLPAGQPVRVARVTGGVRLQVHPIEGAELGAGAPAPMLGP